MGSVTAINYRQLFLGYPDAAVRLFLPMLFDFQYNRAIFKSCKWNMACVSQWLASAEQMRARP